ncbi:MAG: hypothetical protein HY315_09205 [Acidobacteria bacterium]|nr:hypothetical protein [Acidobacteriota bacterium]
MSVDRVAFLSQSETAVSRQPSVASRSAWQFSRRNGGFSLLEVLVANLLCLILLLAWSQFLTTLQSAVRTQTEHHQIQLSARLAQRIMTLSVQQAGQDRTQNYLQSPRNVELAVDSDLTGDGGDPDNRLEHPFEKQRFRMDPDFAEPMTGPEFDRTANLQWKSGSGSFQALVSRVIYARFQIDAAPAPRFVVITLQMRGRLLGRQRTSPTRSFQFTSPVEKNRDQWFRYDLPD